MYRSTMDHTVTLSVVYGVSNCCLSLYLDVAGLRKVLEKRPWGSLKVLDFFVTKRVGILNLISVLTSSVECQLIVKSCQTAHSVFL